MVSDIRESVDFDFVFRREAASERVDVMAILRFEHGPLCAGSRSSEDDMQGRLHVDESRLFAFSEARGTAMFESMHAE